MCSTCLRAGESNAICAFKSNPMFVYQRQVKTQSTNIYTKLVLTLSCPRKEEWLNAFTIYM